MSRYPHVYIVTQPSTVYSAGYALCRCGASTVPPIGYAADDTFDGMAATCVYALLERVGTLEGQLETESRLQTSILKARAEAFDAGRETERADVVAYIRREGDRDLADFIETLGHLEDSDEDADDTPSNAARNRADDERHEARDESDYPTPNLKES